MCGGGVGRSGKLSFRIRFGGGPRRGAPHGQSSKIAWKMAILDGFSTCIDPVSIPKFCKTIFISIAAFTDEEYILQEVYTHVFLMMKIVSICLRAKKCGYFPLF